MTDVYQISIAFSDYFEITTAVVVRCGGREMSSRTLTECCNFYWGQTSDIRKSLKPTLGGVTDVAFSSMSHAQTQSNRVCCLPSL